MKTGLCAEMFEEINDICFLFLRCISLGFSSAGHSGQQGAAADRMEQQEIHHPLDR